MTNNSPFEEHIKKQFGEYEPSVPAHIWENIIAQKDRRRPAGFWASLLNNRNKIILLIILMAGGTFLYFDRIKEQPAGTAAQNTKLGDQVNTELKNEAINTEKTQSNTIIKDPTNDADQTNPVGNITKETNSDTKTETADGQQVNVASEKNIGTTGTTLSARQHKGTSPVAGINPGENDNHVTDHLLAVKTEKRSKKTVPQKNRFTQLENNAETDDFYNNERSPVDAKQAGMNRTADLYLSRHLLDLNILYMEKNMNASVTGIHNPHLNIPCPESEKNAAGNKKYFEIYGGPDYAFMRFEDTANSTYLQKRKESTRFAAAFSAGIRYTKVFNNGMSFRTGINYSQVNEKFKFVQGNIIHMVYVLDANGDTTGAYASTGTRYKTTINKYRTLDVPLLIGYELGNGRIHANINAGAVINVYSWQKGDILDKNYQPVNITTGKTASPYQFKTNIGIGFMGAVSFYYKLNDRLHLLAEPYFRYNFSPASKAELTLKQKYNTAGLRIGLRMDF